MSSGTNALLMDVLAKEKASVEKMNRRAKEDIQKVVVDEMEAKKQVEIREAKLEEHRKRMVDLKKKQDEKLKEQKKEGQKKQEKSLEVRLKANRKLEEEAAELAKELAVKDERVEASLKEREEGWE